MSFITAIKKVTPKCDLLIAYIDLLALNRSQSNTGNDVLRKEDVYKDKR